jgi:hypothetical protein
MIFTSHFVLLAFFFLFAGIAIFSVIGWIFEGMRSDKSREEIKRLEYENGELREMLTRRNKLNNVKVADDYAKEGK